MIYGRPHEQKQPHTVNVLLKWNTLSSPHARLVSSTRHYWRSITFLVYPSWGYRFVTIHSLPTLEIRCVPTVRKQSARTTFHTMQGGLHHRITARSSSNNPWASIDTTHLTLFFYCFIFHVMGTHFQMIEHLHHDITSTWLIVASLPKRIY
jgi:hypothetical protein